jgi:hypothetical protein
VGWWGVGAEWREGIAYLLSSRIRILFGATCLVALGDGLIAPHFVIFVKEVLGGGAPEVGLWVTINAVGGIAGGLLAARIAAGRAPARLLGLGQASVGGLVLARNSLPALLPRLLPGVSPAAALALNAPIGASGAIGGAAALTLFQRLVPDGQRGRIFGAAETTQAALMLVGVAAGRRSPRRSASWRCFI